VLMPNSSGNIKFKAKTVTMIGLNPGKRVQTPEATSDFGKGGTI